MNPPNASTTSAGNAAFTVPKHWTPEQALAVFECLHSMRLALSAAAAPAFHIFIQSPLAFQPTVSIVCSRNTNPGTTATPPPDPCPPPAAKPEREHILLQHMNS